MPRATSTFSQCTCDWLALRSTIAAPQLLALQFLFGLDHAGAMLLPALPLARSVSRGIAGGSASQSA